MDTQTQAGPRLERPQDLERLAPLNTMNVWVHLTNNALADVLAPGYFERAAAIVEKHDRIIATCPAHGDKPEHTTLVVVEADAAIQNVVVEALREVAGAVKKAG